MTLGNPIVKRTVSKLGLCEADAQRATYKGIYLKAALYAALTIVAAVLVELLLLHAINAGYIEQAFIIIGIAAAVSFIPMLIISLIIAFKPSTAKVLGCFYAVFQGGLLGIAALLFDMFFPGIAFAALVATVIVFVVSLVANGVLKARVTSQFLRGLTVAFTSILIVQMIMFILSLFGVFNYTAYLWIQIAASSLCVIWATVMLSWDLQNIDSLVMTGADKSCEWPVAFSLVTTLIYMYVEILELLFRLACLFAKNKN